MQGKKRTYFGLLPTHSSLHVLQRVPHHFLHCWLQQVQDGETPQNGTVRVRGSNRRVSTVDRK